MAINIEAIRAEFPVLERCAYFTPNGLGPLPRRTRDAALAAYDAYMENGVMGHFQYTDALETARERGAQLLGAEPVEVAFCRNTGEGILWAANAIRWESGDEVIVPLREYPSLVYPFVMLERLGVRVVMPPMEEPVPESRRVTVDVIRGAITAKTRAVALSFVQFDCGYRADLEAIGALCDEHGLLLIVDAIQGLGAVPLDVHACRIAFLAAGGHKWMLSTQGTGLFFARADLIEQLEPTHHNFGGMLTSSGLDTDTHAYPVAFRPGAARFEEGSRNMIGIIGQSTSLAFLLEIGMDDIAARVRELTDYLCAGAEAAGCTILSHRTDQTWSGITLFSPPPGGDAGAIQSACLADGILLNNHEGNVHLGVHFYNTHEEIDRVLAHLG